MLPALLLAAVPAALPAGALSEEAFQQLLESGNRQQLVQGCQRVVELGLDQRLRQLRVALLNLHEDSSNMQTLFADTRALLRCKAPDAALEVLERISPDEGPERQEWLRLQWQAASAGLDQRRAALALRRLSQADAQALNQEQLTLVEPQAPGELPVQRSALDVQAEQLEAIGDEVAAAELLMQPADTAQLTAKRRQKAARLLAVDGLELEAAELIGESIDLAAADAAWGLSTALLNDQREYELAAAETTAAQRTNARRLRLSRRLADGMSERAAVLSAIADQTDNPALAQELIDRRDPLERRSGALFDALLSLAPPRQQESPADRLARLDLAVQVALRLGHRERLLDLLVLQEREARVQGDAWLRDRVTRLAVQQSGGNPLRQREALIIRQRELLEDPVFAESPWRVWYPEVPQERLEALQNEEDVAAEKERRIGFDPFPVTYKLPGLFEDIARLKRAKKVSSFYELPPAFFGKLPRRISSSDVEIFVKEIDLARQSMELDEALIVEGDEVFTEHVDRLARREELAAFLSQDLAAGELNPNAVSRRREWLALERQLEPRSETIRQLAAFGRSPKGISSLERLHQQEDFLRAQSRFDELQGIQTTLLAIQEKLEPEASPRFQPRFIASPQEQKAVALTEQWQLFISGPTAETAQELQRQAAASQQDALELEALRLRLALVLPRGSADSGLVESLKELELRLRSPQSRGGHLGPPSPSR